MSSELTQLSPQSYWILHIFHAANMSNTNGIVAFTIGLAPTSAHYLQGLGNHALQNGKDKKRIGAMSWFRLTCVCLTHFYSKILPRSIHENNNPKRCSFFDPALCLTKLQITCTDCIVLKYWCHMTKWICWKKCNNPLRRVSATFFKKIYIT